MSAGDLKVTGLTVGKYGEQAKNYELSTETQNYYRQQPAFTAMQKDTMATDYIDDVQAFLSGADASDRDKTATDIAARSLNVSGPKFLKGSDMDALFNAVNADDFDAAGKLAATSDGKVKLFSKEAGGYGIVDEEGNIYCFDKDGKFINPGGVKFDDVVKAARLANDRAHGKVAKAE